MSIKTSGSKPIQKRRWGRWVRSIAILGGLALVVQVAWGKLPKAVNPVATAVPHHQFIPFGFLWSHHFQTYERLALFGVLAVALCGLAYAGILVRTILAADQGTDKMRTVARAIREGSSAYLRRQRRALLPIIGILTLVVMATAPWHTSAGANLAIGRGIAFLMGSLASLSVGTIGMLMATRGNICMAAAAPKGFGKALRLGYCTGTVTGMLIDGLGLLGATLIFMYFGDRAPAALLGFGFGGTLLALFMRVGGGIYTKAADVGADLVGKIEKDIPEDDPRNAATIADNVGDNVGDCAGMAADIFESYEVTLVAAMILGWASFGHKGVLFPLLVQAGGVVADIISTLSVRAGKAGGVKEAMGSLNFGYRFGAVVSAAIIGIIGFFYLRFNPQGLGLAQLPAGFEAHSPIWANWGIRGLDMRPAEAAWCGLILGQVLNFCTEYFTGTEHAPVKSLVRACSTGHATNIIAGLEVGMESSVWATLAVAACIMASVLIFSGTSPIFVAFGVAMSGIGMLTLTGNTMSMDVFGPVADNANGVAEMGYEPDKMDPAVYKTARQVLADLDATGNTTKAITKGIAIGSAVIAAVSLFASFVTIIGSGGGSERAHLAQTVYHGVASMLTLGNPRVFIGLLIGGTVPFLFSSMTIRAVGRAAFLIVEECRAQFRDKEIWNGNKQPDYGRVVNICTLQAQRELIGPGLLAVLAPVLVAFLLGALALAGFLAGAILAGQLMAVFMANTGGAWDNAKKVVEDEPRDPAHNLGKGSDRHKASVTGDTVGDPLKDTAGPAINPLIKVMNMVSLLVIPIALPFDHGFLKNAARFVPGYVGVKPAELTWVPWAVTFGCILALGWALYRSKHESPAMAAAENDVEMLAAEADPVGK